MILASNSSDKTTVWDVETGERGALKAGETLLCHGGSSGIGTTAIQLARATGCRVITTAGTEEKCRFCEALGADRAVNYRDADWPAEVREFSGGRGVDVVLDMVAGPYVQKNLDCLAKEGRLAIIAFLGGPESELNLRVLLAKRLTITGSTLRPQSNEEKARIAEALAQHVLPLLAAGTVRPVIHATFPLAEAAAAHELMESGRHRGKIVLTVAAGN